MYKDPVRMLLLLESAGIKPLDDLRYMGQPLYTQEALVQAVQLALEDSAGGASVDAPVDIDGFAVAVRNLPHGDLGSIVKLNAHSKDQKRS